MTGDQICRQWLQNKCFEFRFDDKNQQWFCGSAGVYRPHLDVREDWSIRHGSAFRFRIKACPELNHQIQWFGRDAEDNPPPDPLPNWSIPVIADTEYTPVGQIYDFIVRRLVSYSLC